jgi:hypothetical protein
MKTREEQLESIIISLNEAQTILIGNINTLEQEIIKYQMPVNNMETYKDIIFNGVKLQVYYKYIPYNPDTKEGGVAEISNIWVKGGTSIYNLFHFDDIDDLADILIEMEEQDVQ